MFRFTKYWGNINNHREIILKMQILMIHEIIYAIVKCSTRSCPHSRIIIKLVARVTRRVPLVKSEPPTFPEHLSSWMLIVGFVLLIFSFLSIIVCHVVRWRLANVLLPFTASDYPFSIFIFSEVIIKCSTAWTRFEDETYLFSSSFQIVAMIVW